MALEGSCHPRNTTFSLRKRNNNTSNHTTSYNLEPLPSHTHTIKSCHPTTPQYSKCKPTLGRKVLKPRMRSGWPRNRSLTLRITPAVSILRSRDGGGRGTWLFFNHPRSPGPGAARTSCHAPPRQSACHTVMPVSRPHIPLRLELLHDLQETARQVGPDPMTRGPRAKWRTRRVATTRSRTQNRPESQAKRQHQHTCHRPCDYSRTGS